MAEKGKAIVEYRSQGGVDISLTPETVRNFLVQGKKELVSAQELMYFMNVCKARKLNPFIKDCYLIKYGSDPAAIVTSVDYFRKNARKAPDCKGWRAGIVILKDGELTYREGSLILDDETLVGGWAEAKPKGNIRKKHTVGLKPYIKKTRDGKTTSFWRTEKQPDMIAKVAESQLLRQLWGEETTGMYSVEEMPAIEDVKSDGPVQSEIKQRILDGVKKADDVRAEVKKDYPKVQENAEKDTVFKSAPLPEPEPEPEPALKPEPNGRKKKVPLKDLEAKSKAWESENWSRLKSTGFSTYVWKNIGTLAGEPEVLQKAVRHKWGKMFKDAFPEPGGNKINGNGNGGENMLQAEVYHDPNGNGNHVAPDSDFQQPAPDKEKSPDEFLKWLKLNFEEELSGALDYLNLTGRLISALSPKDKVELIKQTERLIDMNAQ